MKHFTIKLNEIYKEISGFEATLTAYIPDVFSEIDNSRKHPAMLVMPGGGYWWVSDRESEPVALALLGEGYAVFCLKYSTVNDSAAKFPDQLLQACFSMKYIKDNAEKFNIDADRVFAMGFSAGGHLCGSLGLLYNSQYVKKVMPDYEIARPAAMVLCYPVISAGQHSHGGSINNLLGEIGTPDDVSLEKAVTKNSPPAFVWHTFDDNVVPVMNPILLAVEYAKAKVPLELHIFDKGSHGLSLADWRTASAGNVNSINPDAAVWFELLLNYLKRR